MRSRLFFVFVFLLLGVYSCQEQGALFQPIGYFQSKYTIETGAPRQGMLIPESKACIVLDEKYISALHDLDDFEYIWVLYHFDKAEGWEPEIIPPEGLHEFGLFATRSPRRPNPIGLSLVRLDSVKENVLYISNSDAFDKTPVLDIKPYLPSVDYIFSQKNIDAEIELGHHDEDFINDSLVKIFVKGEK